MRRNFGVYGPSRDFQGKGSFLFGNSKHNRTVDSSSYKAQIRSQKNRVGIVKFSFITSTRRVLLHPTVLEGAGGWRATSPSQQYCSGFFHTLTLISHGCTCVPHPEPLSHFPPHPIPQGHPSASALSTLSHASNLDWRSVSHMIIYMFQYHSLKSSHPCLLPQSPKVCSLHLRLFCCLAYRVIVTIFLKPCIFLTREK